MNWKAGSGTERDVRSDRTPSETLAGLRYLAWGWDIVKKRDASCRPDVCLEMLSGFKTLRVAKRNVKFPTTVAQRKMNSH